MNNEMNNEMNNDGITRDIVVTEEWYVGGNKIKVFKRRAEAEAYIDNLDDDEKISLIIVKKLIYSIIKIKY